MDIKTYFDKSNTIIYNSEVNTGQNPICELYYGYGYTRILIGIDTDKIKSMVTDKTFSDVNKIKHVLKMKNAWGLQSLDSNIVFNSGASEVKERASSFDLYLFRMPENWDAGIGNDYTKDGFITSNYVYSENASNWYVSSGLTEWTEGPGAVSGTTDKSHPYFIAEQHFYNGNEDLEIDITNEINSIVYSGATNNGFIITFPSNFENTSMDLAQYTGFISSKTSTFYKPYLETIYNEDIVDDRNEFYIGKENRLYFYSLIGGYYRNLDSIPECSIDGIKYDVKQATKGIYYVVVPASYSSDLEEGQMCYDTWSGIIYNGKLFSDVELDFVAKSQEDYFNFNNLNHEQDKYVPSVYGIKYGEKVNRGDIRKIFVNPRVEYTTKVVNNITDMSYRVYVKDANKELSVINYQPINRTLNSNFFLIDTESLLPNKYFVDIKITRNDEEITHKDKLMFEIINEI